MKKGLIKSYRLLMKDLEKGKGVFYEQIKAACDDDPKQIKKAIAEMKKMSYAEMNSRIKALNDKKSANSSYLKSLLTDSIKVAKDIIEDSAEKVANKYKGQTAALTKNEAIDYLYDILTSEDYDY